MTEIDKIGNDPASSWQNDNEVPSTWKELLPRQKKAVYEFVADIKTISIEAAKQLCVENPIDAAFIANAIRNNFAMSRKWRSSLDATIPVEAWTESEEILGLRELSHFLDGNLHIFAEPAGVSENRELAGLANLKEVHLKLLWAVPQNIHEMYNDLICWMDSSNLKLSDAHPLMEFGGIRQLVFAVEHMYNQTCTELGSSYSLEPEYQKQIIEIQNAIGKEKGIIELSEMMEHAFMADALEIKRTAASVNCYNAAVLNCLDAIENFKAAAEATPQAVDSVQMAEEDPRPGLLIASLLCDLSVNRAMRENNRICKIQQRAGQIAEDFLIWSDQNLCVRGWDIKRLLSEECRQAWVECNFGESSRYAQENPKRALTSGQISALIRTSTAISESEITAAREQGSAVQEELFQGANLLAFCACYFTGSKVQSDKHDKSMVMTFAGRTGDSLESWVPSAEGRLLLQTILALFYEALCSDLLAPVYVRTSAAILRYRTLFRNELLFRTFKGLSIGGHRAHYCAWKHASQSTPTEADDVIRFISMLNARMRYSLEPT